MRRTTVVRDVERVILHGNVMDGVHSYEFRLKDDLRSIRSSPDFEAPMEIMAMRGPYKFTMEDGLFTGFRVVKVER